MLIKRGKTWARIDVHTSENSLRTVKLQEDGDKTKKSFEIDDKTYIRLPQAKKQPVVLFDPDALRILHSEPSRRREYFDEIIEQSVAEYARTRAQYQRALLQRNTLLKQGQRAHSQLFAWDLRLSDIAQQLIVERLKLVEKINKTIVQVYAAVAKHEQPVTLEYQSSVDAKNYGTDLLKKLKNCQEQDLIRGFTGYGPHRDDFVLYFGDRPAAESASRGEVRTLLLALKIIEMQILEEHTGTKPLLLLDDVFSELDGARRRALTSFLSDHQTIITTTDADIVLKHFTKDTTVIPLG